MSPLQRIPAGLFPPAASVLAGKFWMRNRGRGNQGE
ncbi:hypothetical protein SLEP1_g12582 [Rubroshorea leprosula]|uniref:Uncharacterized protein n=1 Tax=Rubroshorea leprosula TaxID=152421 RepID=A0AAV5IIU1_9ROSI|nr:hypothetical protein SLEP1_g12582 [Rubroshorea leprosula]